MNKPEKFYYDNYPYTGEREETTHQRIKVVKTRKEHLCVFGQHPIKAGSDAVLETAFLDDKPVSCYVCTECIEKSIEFQPEAGMRG